MLCGLFLNKFVPVATRQSSVVNRALIALWCWSECC